MFNTKITRSCDDVVENASSPSACRIRTVPVDPYRLVSPSRWFQIHDSARGCTGRDRNLLSPSPRVVPLSVLFVAVVQSYRRQCGVLRCPNRRKAIRNHALNRRVSAGNDIEATFFDDRTLLPSPGVSSGSPF